MNESGRLFSETVTAWLTRASGLEAKLAYSYILESGTGDAGNDISSSDVDCIALSVAEPSVYGKVLPTYLLEDLLEESSPGSRQLDRLNRTREFGWLPVRAALARGLLERTNEQEFTSAFNYSLPSGGLHSGGGAGAGFQVYCDLDGHEVMLASGGGGGGGGLSIPIGGAPSFGGGGGGGVQLRYFLNTSLDQAGNLPPLSPWESFGGGTGCNSITVVDSEGQNMGNNSNDALNIASTGRCAVQPVLGGAAASCGRSFDDDCSEFSNRLFSNAPGAALRESVQQCVKWGGDAVVRGGGGGGGGTSGAACGITSEPTSGHNFGFGFGFLAVAGHNSTISKESSYPADMVVGSSFCNSSNRRATAIAVANLKISQLVRNASSTESSAACMKYSNMQLQATSDGALVGPIECPWSCRCESARLAAYQHLIEQRHRSQSNPNVSPGIDHGQVHAILSALAYTRCGDCSSINTSVAATHEQLYRRLLAASAELEREMDNGVSTDLELAAEAKTDSHCWTAAVDRVPPCDNDGDIEFLDHHSDAVIEGVEAPTPSDLENNRASFLRRFLNPAPLSGLLAMTLGAVLLWRRRRVYDTQIAGRQRYIEIRAAVPAVMPTKVAYEKCTRDSCHIQVHPAELTPLVLSSTFL